MGNKLFSKNKSKLGVNLIISAIVVALVILIVVLSMSGNKTTAVEVDLKTNQSKVIENLKNNSTIKNVGNATFYTTDDIKFLKGENVDVKYYFYGDDKAVSRIVFDVSKSNDKKVNKILKGFNKSYKKVKSTKKTIEGSTRVQTCWVSEDAKIYYEKQVTNAKDKKKYISKLITFIPIKK